MAPECCDRKKFINLYSIIPSNFFIIADVDGFSGRAADIWALGVTLYCMVYNRLPFFDENEFGII
jgi:serine/threonine protein kinase